MKGWILDFGCCKQAAVLCLCVLNVIKQHYMLYYRIKTTYNRWIWRRLLNSCYFHNETPQHSMLMWHSRPITGMIFLLCICNILPLLTPEMTCWHFLLTALLLGCVKFNWSRPGWFSRSSDSQGLKSPGIESRWGSRFSAPVHTGPGGPLILLYNGYRVILGGKAAGAWRWPHTTSSAEVKGREGLYLSSPFGPSWPVIGWT